MKISNSLILLFCFSLQVSQSGLAAEDYTVPRTEWGQADLQGVWNFTSNVPMQRPEHFGQRQFLTDDEITAIRIQRLELGAGAGVAPPASGIESYSRNIWVENSRFDGDVRTSHIVYPSYGRLPPPVEGIENQPGGVVEVAGQRPVRFVVGGISRDGPEDRGLSERCIVGFNAGPPFTPSLYNNNVQIIQNRDHVAILTEMIHDARIIKFDARPALDENLGLWSGDSRGHWEDDTLVVVTQNFNGMTQSFDGFGTSENKVLTERFTRIDSRTLNYEFTIDDPSTFTDKLTAIVPMTKVAGQLYEYACHEGNYGMANMLRAARRREVNEVSDRVADLFRRQ
ncbi:MAG: hypothetical protein QGG02_14170 [Gammaproteobacteria bacterium]|jgi:hypothetical protein|nr:hypothetical protein [Gammaproteobacteria bacterium]|tara:strand:+ start:1539 stop:2558 length:1020 start_codon:yes stop_codon:yes gene_type:complete